MAFNIKGDAEGIIRNKTDHTGVCAVGIEHGDVAAKMTDKSAIFSGDDEGGFGQHQGRSKKIPGGSIKDADCVISVIDDIKSPSGHIGAPRIKPHSEPFGLLASG